MKNKKIKLADLKVNSFVTGQTSSLKGGRPGFTFDCPADLWTEKCVISDGYACEASYDNKCAWTIGALYCG